MLHDSQKHCVYGLADLLFYLGGSLCINGIHYAIICPSAHFLDVFIVYPVSFQDGYKCVSQIVEAAYRKSRRAQSVIKTFCNTPAFDCYNKIIVFFIPSRCIDFASYSSAET